MQVKTQPDLSSAQFEREMLYPAGATSESEIKLLSNVYVVATTPEFAKMKMRDRDFASLLFKGRDIVKHRRLSVGSDRSAMLF